MTLRIDCVTVDCSDPARLARFWSQALGWMIDFEDDAEVAVTPSSSHEGHATDLLFLRVPGAKQVKNRLHLDLRPDDQDAEVARLEGLGARRVDIGQGDSQTWVVMADPEGNEFCVLRVLDDTLSKYEGDVGEPA